MYKIALNSNLGHKNSESMMKKYGKNSKRMKMCKPYSNNNSEITPSKK
jgi:hypothetical protein